MNKVLFLSFLAASVLSAGTISTLTTCQVPDQESVSGTTYCSGEGTIAQIGLPGNLIISAQATSHDGYSVSGNEVNATFDQSAAVHFFNGGSNCCSSHAEADGSIALELNTPGPVRSGYLMFASPVGGGGTYEGYETLTAEVGNYSGGCTQYGYNSPSCDGAIRSAVAIGLANLLPFTLGDDFTFNATATSMVTCISRDTVCEAGWNVPVDLRFFESDGLTPVTVSEVPEPVTAGMTILVLAFIFCTKLAARRTNDIRNRPLAANAI